jgi:hypothetical protein
VTTGAIEAIRARNPYIVIVDYKLGGGVLGDTFINELRKGGLFHDVFFYTQDGFKEEDQKRFFPNFSTGLSMGVHFADKNHAKRRLCEIIDLKLSQVSDLPTQRGWIVADAIELEHQLDEILEALSAAIHPSLGGTVNRLIEDPRVDFGCRAQLLNGLLKDFVKYVSSMDPRNGILTSLAAIRSKTALFTAEIIQIRNSIAHQKHTEAAAGVITIEAIQPKQPPITYNAEFLQQVRRNIGKHQSAFGSLQTLINTEIPAFYASFPVRS